ncbi:hypothetical protein DOTSEDRAFT_67595 [Lecanosticta acicola]|uniref:Acetyltransferase n=1 Tax=Lecanosticta acicola TaxID=111012 RepID=A0AAI8Z554_9PEZI|nr:hypothetical protein DOTSEDRAFT_67595 [Lecanosticta acicola]
MAQPITAGRIVMILGNLVYSVGAFLADYSETHVFNPRWPPHHARFHNGQTMSLGLLLATSSLYYLFRPARDLQETKDNLFTSALIGEFYCVAALSAILYPGTAWQDPEFRQGGEQRYIFGIVCVAMVVGYWLESRRLGKTKTA